MGAGRGAGNLFFVDRLNLFLEFKPFSMSLAFFHELGMFCKIHAFSKIHEICEICETHGFHNHCSGTGCAFSHQEVSKIALYIACFAYSFILLLIIISFFVLLNCLYLKP